MGVLFKEIDHIIERQYAAEEAFLAEYKKGSYTIDHPYVVVNPYIIAPLTALVMFEAANLPLPRLRLRGKRLPAITCTVPPAMGSIWCFPFTGCILNTRIPL